MIFAAPWVLLALPALPLLWWLLRVTAAGAAQRILPGDPPADGPARAGGDAGAHALVAAGTADAGGDAGDRGRWPRPVLDAGSTLAGSGPVLLVFDNGWAAAGDWQHRMQAADNVLDRAERAGRPVALLATAPDEAGAAPQVTAAMPVVDLRPKLAALHPEPWPPDRASAAAALRAWRQPRRGGGLSRRRPYAWRRFRRLRRGTGRGRCGDRTARPGHAGACCCRHRMRPTGWWRGSPRCRSRCRRAPPSWRRAVTAGRWHEHCWNFRRAPAKARPPCNCHLNCATG